MNKQQLLFLEGLLMGIKEGKTQQNQPLTIGVTEKHEGIKFKIEVYPNSNHCLPYRLLFENGDSSLWSTWDDLEDIQKSFQMMSLI